LNSEKKVELAEIKSARNLEKLAKDLFAAAAGAYGNAAKSLREVEARLAKQTGIMRSKQSEYALAHKTRVSERKVLAQMIAKVKELLDVREDEEEDVELDENDLEYLDSTSFEEVVADLAEEIEGDHPEATRILALLHELSKRISQEDALHLRDLRHIESVVKDTTAERNQKAAVATVAKATMKIRNQEFVDRRSAADMLYNEHLKLDKIRSKQIAMTQKVMKLVKSIAAKLGEIKDIEGVDNSKRYARVGKLLAVILNSIRNEDSKQLGTQTLAQKLYMESVEAEVKARKLRDNTKIAMNNAIAHRRKVEAEEAEASRSYKIDMQPKREKEYKLIAVLRKMLKQLIGNKGDSIANNGNKLKHIKRKLLSLDTEGTLSKLTKDITEGRVGTGTTITKLLDQLEAKLRAEQKSEEANIARLQKLLATARKDEAKAIATYNARLSEWKQAKEVMDSRLVAKQAIEKQFKNEHAIRMEAVTILKKTVSQLASTSKHHDATYESSRVSLNKTMKKSNAKRASKVEKCVTKDGKKITKDCKKHF